MELRAFEKKTTMTWNEQNTDLVKSEANWKHSLHREKTTENKIPLMFPTQNLEHSSFKIIEQNWTAVGDPRHEIGQSGLLIETNDPAIYDDCWPRAHESIAQSADKVSQVDVFLT